MKYFTHLLNPESNYKRKCLDIEVGEVNITTMTTYPSVNLMVNDHWGGLLVYCIVLSCIIVLYYLTLYCIIPDPLRSF